MFGAVIFVRGPGLAASREPSSGGPGSTGPGPDALYALAADFTPRFERCGPDTVVLDLNGVARLFGDARTIANELHRAARDRGLDVCLALAGSASAARLLAAALLRGQRPDGPRRVIGQESSRVAIVAPGDEAAALAPLPLELLALLELPELLCTVAPSAPSDAPSHPRTSPPSHPLLSTFHRWGLRAIGELAALSADEVAARLGSRGVYWHRLARGEDPRPLRPEVPPERFEQALDLEWPIDGLEPLSFVLGRLLEPLAQHLDRRGRGAAVLHVRLHLVTRAIHERSLQLPVPIRDARTFRTLLLLDLESNPPAAAIDRVAVAVDPTPARVVQFSLLTRPLPSPEQISTLMARLTALMGEGRCGSPATVDSWLPGVFTMRPFAPADEGIRSAVRSDTPQRQNEGERTSYSPALALRRFRAPVPARVRADEGSAGTPVHVVTDRRGLAGGRVAQWAGPWRTSGGWWADGPWDRDEWDVTLGDGGAYRVFRDRATGRWFVEGTYD